MRIKILKISNYNDHFENSSIRISASVISHTCSLIQYKFIKTLKSLFIITTIKNPQSTSLGREALQLKPECSPKCEFSSYKDCFLTPLSIQFCLIKNG